MPRRPLAYFALIAFVSVPALAQTSAGWKTYRDSKFEFTVAYPPDMKLYDFARGEKPDNYAPVCDETTVACFGYTGQDYTGTNFDGAGIAINILRDAKNEQQCSNIGSAEYPRMATQLATIHGTTFHVGEIGEGGMSHFQAITAYRAIRQNVCFEIRTQINSVNIGVYDPGTVKEFDPARLKALFSQMARTFRFTAP
jgi:hypothetical protein